MQAQAQQQKNKEINGLKKIEEEFNIILKPKSIITSTLRQNEYFRVSNCSNAREMWDTLQLTHEGATDVKRSRFNTLTHEYELYRMNTNENIQSM